MRALILFLLLANVAFAKENISLSYTNIHDSDASNIDEVKVEYVNKQVETKYTAATGARHYNDGNYLMIEGGVTHQLTPEVGVSLKLGALDTFMIGHAEVVYAKNKFKAAVSYEKDVTDTEDGLKHDITNDTVGGYIDYQFSQNFTGTYGIFSQKNSDDVELNIQVLKLSYQINDAWQLILMRKNVDRDIPSNYTPPYFHPEQDDKTLLIAKYAFNVNEHNHITLTGGYGKRDLDYDVLNLYEYGIKWKSSLTDSLIMNTGIWCFSDSNSYRYCKGSISFDFFF
jgi:hypothetical protein